MPSARSVRSSSSGGGLFQPSARKLLDGVANGDSSSSSRLLSSPAPCKQQPAAGGALRWCSCFLGGMMPEAGGGPGADPGGWMAPDDLAQAGGQRAAWPERTAQTNAPSAAGRGASVAETHATLPPTLPQARLPDTASPGIMPPAQPPSLSGPSLIGPSLVASEELAKSGFNLLRQGSAPPLL